MGGKAAYNLGVSLKKPYTEPLAKHHRVCEKPVRRRCYILFEVGFGAVSMP
jgi:hypothetical protein